MVIGMRIAVMGAGGVGGYFGGLLARAGHDVHFVARGAHLKAIRERGLQVESVHGDFQIVPAQVDDDPQQIGLVELVLLCVKTYGLETALAQIRPLVGPDTAVLTLQNGIEAPDRVAEAFGRDHVLPGVVYCEVAVKAPGVIAQGTPIQRIVFGELDGMLSTRAERIGSVFCDAGIETVVSDQALAALWSKCCFISAMSGVTTLVRQPLGVVLADQESRRLLRTVMEETRAVAQAKGILFGSDPVELGMEMAERFPAGAKSSMLRDLERGGQLEVEALNGAVVREGRAMGVPTPANQAIYAALRLLQAS
jgi:2-dehydropantoate 2-reductase